MARLTPECMSQVMVDVADLVRSHLEVERLAKEQLEKIAELEKSLQAVRERNHQATALVLRAVEHQWKGSEFYYLVKLAKLLGVADYSNIMPLVVPPSK